jgi:hypothetical protein
LPRQPRAGLLPKGPNHQILVLHSTRIAAELSRRRADASWPAEPQPVGPADKLTFESVSLTLSLEDLYARTHLALP